MSPTYYQRRRERRHRRAMAGVAARERNRLARAAECLAWPIVRILTVLDPATGQAHRWILRAGGERGRLVALEVDGRVSRIGSERTLRAQLARAMWRAAA